MRAVCNGLVKDKKADARHKEYSEAQASKDLLETDIGDSSRQRRYTEQAILQANKTESDSGRKKRLGRVGKKGEKEKELMGG